MEKETWRIYPYNRNYAVSDFGRVMRITPAQNTEPGYILSPGTATGGYQVVGLYPDDKPTKRIHKLVLETFVGPCPKRHEGNHKDGNKANNRLDNLEYLTKKENFEHAIRTGLFNVKGENHPQSKLTDDDIREIRRLFHEEGLSKYRIGRIMNIDRRYIGKILSGERWGHVK